MTPVRPSVGLFPEIDGRSPAIAALKRDMARVAGDPFVTVLLQGESGTGKERVARAIHAASARARAPLVVVNCAGLSPTLVEDELFGHVRGAFTGALIDRPGPFERAQGGTLFLDEVGELASDLQVKLLRALQERTVLRLGASRATAFDVRVIAATHVDLTHATATGRFREDLYYRLKVYELHVPALRHRGEADIRLLITAILRRLAERRRQPTPDVDPALLARLVPHPWPGNVRELENVLERMLVAAGGRRLLTVHELPDTFGRLGPVSRGAGASASSPPRRLPTPGEARMALLRHGSHRARAAEALHLSRHQLYRLLRRSAPYRSGD